MKAALTMQHGALNEQELWGLQEDGKVLAPEFLKSIVSRPNLVCATGVGLGFHVSGTTTAFSNR